jgi:hypothetical protein
MLLHYVNKFIFQINFFKNESVLKAFALYAIKNYKQNESSILSIFKQALSDGIKSKEVYALAV